MAPLSFLLFSGSMGRFSSTGRLSGPRSAARVFVGGASPQCSISCRTISGPTKEAFSSHVIIGGGKYLAGVFPNKIKSTYHDKSILIYIHN